MGVLLWITVNGDHYYNKVAQPLNAHATCTNRTQPDTNRSTRNLGLSGATLYHDRNAYPPGLIDIPLPDLGQHMGKGSQLSQLKSALSQAGLSRQSHPGRKRRRAQSEEKDHAKRAARLREIQQKLNPFDVKVTKLKHDVGGRKLKGVSGKPAQTKQAGIEAVSRVHAVLPLRSSHFHFSFDLSEKKRFSKSSRRRTAQAESLIGASVKMTQLSHQKNVCSSVSRGRGSAPPRVLHSISRTKSS